MITVATVALGVIIIGFGVIVHPTRTIDRKILAAIGIVFCLVALVLVVMSAGGANGILI